MAEYLESEGERGADVVAACKGVPVLVEVILEAENQRMLNALMGACVGVLPARKVNHALHFSLARPLRSPTQHLPAPIFTPR